MAEERLGASFSIDVTQLKAGLRTANKLIKESQSQFKAAAAGLDDWSKSEKGLTAKIKSLNSITDIQQKKVDALNKEYQDLIKQGLDPTSDRAVELRTKINQEEAALESNKAELKRQTAALEELQNSSDDAGDEIEDLGEQTQKTSGSFTVMKGALASLVADGFRAAIQAAKNFSKELVNVGMTFDDSMAQVAAVSGATAEELETLRDKAKEMGSTTKFTASEAADAFNYMAMAGWKTEQMIGGIDGILNLAAASGTDLATTSDIVTDALTAMGYEAKDAGRLADVMAAASSNANTNVEMMGQTFQYAAPLVGALGYTMEDTALAIGLMANSGIKGEKAGTALRSMFTRLASPPKDCAESLKKLGVSLLDTNGKMKTFDQVMRDLRKAFANLDEVEQATHASHIAGQEAMSGLLAIVNAAPADYEKLTQAIEQSDGAAEKMASTMLDTLGGDMTVLKSQIEGVRLSIYEKLSPTLRGFVKEAQKAIGKINWQKVGTEANKILKKLADTAKSFAKNVLPIVSKALSVVGKALKFVIDNFKTLAPAVLMAVTAFKAFKAVMAVTTAITAAKTAVAGLTAGVGLATKAQAAWNAVMAANPIGAVITAVGLLAGGIALLVQAEKNASDTTEKLTEKQKELKEKTDTLAESYSETKQAADELAGSNAANYDYVSNNLLPQLQNLVDANGKVKEGEEARAQFILGELNKALGTEYENLSDIVDANGKIKDSIYDLIDAKKAQMLLEVYEDDYKKAIEGVKEAEQGRVDSARELADVQTKLTAAQEKLNKVVQEMHDPSYEYSYDTLSKEYEDANKAVANLETQLTEMQATYNENDRLLTESLNTIATYEKASADALSGNTQAAIDALTTYGNGFKTASSVMKESAEEQKKILGQQVIDTEVNLQLMEKDYEKYSAEMTEEEKKQAQARIENARKQANDAKVEFQAVGGNITRGIAEGADSEQWVLNKAMQNIIKNAVKAAKDAADIKSPSKLFRRVVGLMIGRGIAVGIDDSTQGVLNSVKKQVKNIEQAYDFNGFKNSVDAGLNVGGTGNVNNSRTVTVNQYNTYSQQHSRYELYKSKQQTAAAVRLALGTV